VSLRNVSAISAPPCACPHELIEGVNERHWRLPLFVEEVTRLLVERGEQGCVQSHPPTLQQSLARRPRSVGALRARSSQSARVLDAISPMRCCADALH